MAATFDLATLVGHIEPFKHLAESIVFDIDSAGNTISVKEAILDLQSDIVTVDHPSLGTAPCMVGLVAGQFVYMDATGDLEAGLADDVTTSRLVGVVVEVDSVGTPCIIKATGSLSSYIGLTVGTSYFLSETVPGGVQSTVPTTAGHVIKKVGVALNSTTLFINTTERLIIRS